MSIISPATIAELGVYYTPAPQGGPSSTRIPLDFSASSVYTLDLTSAQQRNQVPDVQAVFIDNFVSNSDLIITVGGTGQVLRFPANSQGYLPLLVPQPAQLTFSNAGAVAGVAVHLLNFPVTSAIWKP